MKAQKRDLENFLEKCRGILGKKIDRKAVCDLYEGYYDLLPDGGPQYGSLQKAFESTNITREVLNRCFEDATKNNDMAAIALCFVMLQQSEADRRWSIEKFFGEQKFFVTI